MITRLRSITVPSRVRAAMTWSPTAIWLAVRMFVSVTMSAGVDVGWIWSTLPCGEPSSTYGRMPTIVPSTGE